MNYNWTSYNSDYGKINELAEKLNISDITSAVLLNRGVDTVDLANEFLNKDIDGRLDPFLLKDIDIAVDRILQAIEDEEKVIIYGDYDVDGITSTTIMKLFFRHFGLEVDYYIPNRINEGYGLSEKSAKKIIDEDYGLVITVDCGITTIEIVDYFNENGVDVIITDHHACGENIPNAIAVINPNRNDCEYPFKSLAGVGVAYKLIEAACIEIGDDEYAMSLLDLVAIGTIADVMELKGENRLIVDYGLKLISQKGRIGLIRLLETTKPDFDKISSTDIAFGISPKLNAAGRMDTARIGVELLIAEDDDEATEIVNKLLELNEQRKLIEEQILIEAQERIKTADKTDSAIVLYDDSWHSGVLGIVASKMAEIYTKPTILLHVEGDLLKGSARSVGQINIYNCISECSEYVEQFGGHTKVAGLTIKMENIDKFIEKFKMNVANYSKEDLIPSILVDYRITSKDLVRYKVNELTKLEPYGNGNPKPLFVYRNLIVERCRIIGKGNNHMSMLLLDNTNTVSAVWFNMGDMANKVKKDQRVDVICSMELNVWNDKEKIQLVIKDIKIKP